MAANKIVRIGPVALSNVLTTNILNGAVTSMAGPTGITLPQPYILLRRIRIVNKTNAAVTFSLYIGATGANAAGTEYLGTAISIAANSAFDANVATRLESTDFLVGGASAATSLTFEAEGEIGF